MNLRRSWGCQSKPKVAGYRLKDCYFSVSLRGSEGDRGNPGLQYVILSVAKDLRCFQ